MSNPMLVLDKVTVEVGSFVIRDFSLEVGEGECVGLLGPSGCGKTTLLEAICGLRAGVTRGRILIGGEEVTAVPPGGRGVGLVPQDVALFPGLKVREQLEFGMRVQGWGKREMAARVGELAESLGIAGLLERPPDGLSGGEARRVALGRAMALRPRLLCLDEALSGLDEARHAEILGVIREVIAKEGMTVLMVTHSRGEAGRDVEFPA